MMVSVTNFILSIGVVGCCAIVRLCGEEARSDYYVRHKHIYMAREQTERFSM